MPLGRHGGDSLKVNGLSDGGVPLSVPQRHSKDETKLCRQWICGSRSSAILRLYRRVERTTESKMQSLVFRFIFFWCQRMQLSDPND